MARLTVVAGSFAAHVLGARLRSEGIDVELRGAVSGPYPFTVGRMAEVEVWVEAEALDDARLVLLADEVEDALEPEPPVPAEPRPVGLWYVAAGLLVVLVVLALSRAFQMATGLAG